MPKRKVRDILPKSPVTIGGRLSEKLGEHLFVELPFHSKLIKRIKTYGTHNIAIWLLAGEIGSGKTWTLAWLARQARQNKFNGEERWEAVLIPGLGTGGEIRTLVEAIFRGTEHLRKEIAEAESKFKVAGYQKPFERILSHALYDDSTWAVFIGRRGQFPRIREMAQKPPWATKIENQVEFMGIWLSKIYNAGITHLLILIDEFEEVVTQLSPRGVKEFSHGLRNVYDMIEVSERLPNVQIILGATADVATQIKPEEEEERAVAPVQWIQAMRDRMLSTFIIPRLELDQALHIAENTIGNARTVDLPRFIPYDEKAIRIAFDVSNGLARKFSQMLLEMYDIAYANDLSKIDVVVARKAAEKLGLMLPKTETKR